MRKIIRLFPARTVVRYQCSICNTKHKTEKLAAKCEARLVEEQKFRVGQLVRSVQLRYCLGRNYYAKGEVVKIWRPQLPDEDYENRHLGGETARLNSHVLQYEIGFICPHCQEGKSHLYYAPELEAA